MSITVDLMDSEGSGGSSAALTDAQLRASPVPVSVSSASAAGFSTPSAGFPKQTVVSTTSITLLSANANRKYAHISNNSGSPIYIQFSATAVVGQGIRINAGALYTLSGYELWLGAITAISSTPNLSIDLMEAI